jgi:hypothetical protein
MRYSSSKEERASLTDNLIHLRRYKRKKLKRPSDLKRIRSKLLAYIADKDPDLKYFKHIRSDVRKSIKKIIHDKENQQQLINGGHQTSHKRKIERPEIIEKRPKMYDYRAAAAATVTSDYATAKNEEDEENMINAFYQQRYLGGSNNSIATLCNIGNSCYLNSVIYTLRFAPKFLHKLHHLCDDLHYVYQKIGQNKLKSSSLGRNVSGLQVGVLKNVCDVGDKNLSAIFNKNFFISLSGPKRS